MARNNPFRKKMEVVLTLVFSLCLGGACSDEEALFETSDAPIAFSAESDWTPLQNSTRAGTTPLPVGSEMGVFAYYMPNGTTTITNLTPNFMNNTIVTKGATNWSYSPLKYWPNNVGDKVQFFAYHPISSTTDQIAVSGTEKGNPVMNYTLQAGLTDLLAAAPAPADKQTGTVHFLFQHLLGQVRVNIQAAEDYVWLANDEVVEVSKVTLKGIQKSGVFKYVANGSNQLIWNSTSNPGDLVVTSGSTFTKTNSSCEEIAGFPRYLLPTSLSQITLLLKSTINGAVMEEEFTFDLATAVSIAPSSNIVITITFNRDETGFTISADWKDTESHTIIYDEDAIINHH